MQCLQHRDELVTEPVLEGDALGVQPTRHQQHLLVLDVDALDRADPLREVEGFGLRERGGGEPTPLLLPDHRRVQALLDRRPDAEARREDLVSHLIPNHEIGTVSGAQLVDLAEQLVDGIAREHVTQPRLDAHPHQGESARRLPVRRLLELVIAELHTRLAVWVLWMRFRQAHRHVEVVGVCRERASKNRGDELRLDRVHHMRDGVLAGDARDVVRV